MPLRRVNSGRSVFDGLVLWAVLGCSLIQLPRGTVSYIVEDGVYYSEDT